MIKWKEPKIVEMRQESVDGEFELTTFEVKGEKYFSIANQRTHNTGNGKNIKEALKQLIFFMEADKAYHADALEIAKRYFKTFDDENSESNADTINNKQEGDRK